MKRCSKCKINKPLDSFSRDAQKKDGLRSSCRQCNKKGYTRREQGDIKIQSINDTGMQKCTKCKRDLTLDNFRKDKTKRTGYFPSCNDCQRVLNGSKKIDNYGNNSFYTGYRKHILDRDNNQCVISGSKENLHIHHIKTRGSGGTNEYDNLITLSHEVHIGLAHGKDARKYKAIFEDYVTQFKRPEFWDDIMIESKQNESRIKKNRNTRNRAYAKRQREKQKEIFKSTHLGLTPNEYKKKQKKEYIEKFKSENDGLTPRQVYMRNYNNNK